MALTINTNMFSLDTQKNLSEAQSPLAVAMQRLSSGLRINNASDDAAGLAIATRMMRQINGLGQDLLNANNGISFAQTAEGSMTEMTNDLQRIYTLSNQAASYNTSLDRNSMNQEVTQLVSELNRVVSQTRFNGTQFLNQQFSASFQVGTEVNETINISTSNMSPTAYGVQSTVTDFTNSTGNQNSIAAATAYIGLGAGLAGGISSNLTLGGVSMGAAILGSLIMNSSQTIVSRINQYTAQTNVTAFSFGNSAVGSTIIVGTTNAGGTADLAAGYLTINGISIASVAVLGSGGQAASALVTAINNITTQTGVTAVIVGTATVGSTFMGASGYSISLVNTTGAAITVSVATADVSTGAANVGALFFGTQGVSVAAGQNGEIVYTAPLNTTSANITTTGSGTDFNALGVASTSTAISMNNANSVNNVGVATTGAANLTILTVEQGIESMNSAQAYLGAVVNRFSSTVRSIQNIEENTQAAKSRIMDADYAAETSNLTKAMITQQAGISVLAQANTITQQVLSLLPK